MIWDGLGWFVPVGKFRVHEFIVLFLIILESTYFKLLKRQTLLSSFVFILYTINVGEFLKINDLNA